MKFIGLQLCLLIIVSESRKIEQTPRILPPQNDSFAALDNEFLRARPMPFDPRGKDADSTYIITSSCCGYGPFTADAVTNASKKYGLFDVPCLFDDVLPYVAEYGYEFENNQNGIFPLCGNLTEAAYKSPPSNRTEAYIRLQLYWQCRAAAERNRTNQPSDSPIVAEIGHYLFASMTALMDTSNQVIPGSEIGENINSIQAHIAHIRGAARQFNAPFVIDFSAWMQGWILDYSPPPGFWGSQSSSPLGGHSLSLFKRSYFATFFAGANMLVAEAGAVNFFYENTTSAGIFNLSPLGEIGQTLYAFSHGFGSPAVSARGIPYVPIGIVTELSFGAGLGWFYSSNAWDIFPLSDAELATQSLLDALWNGSFQVENQFGTAKSENGYMVGGPFGDVADLLLPRNLTSELLLNSYSVLFLTGIGTDLDESLCAEIVKYVNGGGSIILSAPEAAIAISSGWLPSELLGFSSLTTSPSPFVNLTSVSDVQTGWTRNASGQQPFCVQASTGSFYIKTGGDASVRSGWDGGETDKCCSTDASTCRWFSSSSECSLALPLASVLCRSCDLVSSYSGDVGCPSWSSLSMNIYSVEGITTAEPLFLLNSGDGKSAPCGVLNSPGEGKGSVVTLLVDSTNSALSQSGLGLAEHLLERLTDDVNPVTLYTNSSSGEPGVQLLINRGLTGWLLTLINNNGVVKQPNLVERVDPSQGLNVLVSLKPSFGTVVSSWLSQGGELPVKNAPVIGEQNVTVIVPAGELVILFLEVND